MHTAPPSPTHGGAIATSNAVDLAAELAGAATALVAAVQMPPSRLTQGQWLDLLETCTQVANQVAAVADTAMVRVAAIEHDYAETGELIEVAHPLGWAALDAADLIADRVGCTHSHAEHRLAQALTLAADAAPRLAGDDPSLDGAESEETGFYGVHVAMGEGRVDPFKASILIDELHEAPTQVTQAVLAAVDPELASLTSATLRRRVRRMIARISPDLLQQRAVRARADVALTRRACEPGVDEWVGTFPAEDALPAWAAIDTLARQLRADGVCSTLGQARSKALTDLVTGHATITTTLTLTTPASVIHDGHAKATLDPTSRMIDEPARPGEGGADADLVEINTGTPHAAFVPRGWLKSLTPTRPPRRRAAGRWLTHPVTGGLIDPHGTLNQDTYRPGAELTRLVKARDGHCRFPGCHTAARFCDLDHLRPWPLGPTAAHNLSGDCRRHHRIKQLPGWRVRLQPDGTMTWTDPHDRTRTTAPIDHATPLIIPMPIPVASVRDAGDAPPATEAGTHGDAGGPEDPAAAFDPARFLREHTVASTDPRRLPGIRAGRRSIPQFGPRTHRHNPGLAGHEPSACLRCELADQRGDTLTQGPGPHDITITPRPSARTTQRRRWRDDVPGDPPF